MTDADLKSRELELEYRGFLDDEATDGIYKSKVEDMIKRGETRLLVKINDTRSNPNFRDRARALIENSAQELVAFQRALKEFVMTLDPTYGRKTFQFHIGLQGSFGSRHVTPRTLNSRFLNETVCVEGIVSKMSVVKPNIVKSVLYCPKTKKFTERRHYDLASIEYQPSVNAIEKKDDDGNPVDIEYGKCLYKDHQTLTLQEMPESSPPGQLPRCTDVIVEHDLVDKCKPGDRVQIVGTYRCMPFKQMGFSTTIFRTVVIANHVELMSKEVSVLLTDEDVRSCKKLSRTRKFNIFERLAYSLAPTIYGHENVKKAILAQLLGGVEKILPNGSRLRGDINLLLVGDPSVAKSQLLRFVLSCAPRAVATTGRGSSGVGLTAAITTDPETGDRQIEAGAMVLADRGIVCVDEFDKMSDIDRTAIHEVMEQGKVSICKAGIQARLNARCSVLAAANPIFGNYDPYKKPMENIGMQDSLLSRFDLLFILLDELDREKDTKIAEHVMRTHRYRDQNEQDGLPTIINANANNLTTMQAKDVGSSKTEMFERHNALLHGQRSRERMFTLEFMRKYIHIAKLVKPQLTEEACLMIGEFYSSIRKEEMEKQHIVKTTPITARTLETLIRISTAHAKSRLSTQVEPEDAAEAINLVQYSCYHKVLRKPKIKRKRSSDYGSESDISDVEDGDTRDSLAASRTHKRRRLVSTDVNEEPVAMETVVDTNDDAEMQEEQDYSLADEEKERIKSMLPKFQEILSDIARKAHGAQVLDVDVISTEAIERMGITRREVDILLTLLQKNEDFVLDNNSLYLL